jgi:hypothetical protein
MFSFYSIMKSDKARGGKVPKIGEMWKVEWKGDSGGRDLPKICQTHTFTYIFYTHTRIWDKLTKKHKNFTNFKSNS